MPGEVRIEVDIRDSDLDARNGVVDGFLAASRVIAARRDLELGVETITEDDAAPSAARSWWRRPGGVRGARDRPTGR